MRSTVTFLIVSALSSTTMSYNTTTVSLILPRQEVSCNASAVEAKPDITTFAATCSVLPVASEPNVLRPRMTLTIAQGPSTYSYSLGSIMTQSCVLDAEKDIASCTLNYLYEENEDGEVQKSEMRTRTTEVSGYKSLMVPVPVTAGVDITPIAPGQANGGPTATATSSNSAAGQANGGPTATATSSNSAAGPMAAPIAVVAGVAAVIAHAIIV
ncbi:hypothetical protein DCS_05716 [Drechmeria coniospora]|uniref:Uncharacterized protein n=1 Tax=Drechmeria coniospora TaxID=98403 RepID=A0A151GNL4_DRECN|nr:hypothetical protein DCS_05716 [Drechmeria coniospora]KYK58699.1 hypothetical protein DCS_05716 [Drechmeria coniospora]